ncbi:hypothetical protein GGU11DRAFT_802001 [Lentinula aff. detonsa]|nr:hypothetical protein GGU11DRAFT_802001 [Lentinula aff. detonsa]
MPTLPHPDYPALNLPHFERIDEYQAIWMQHWEEPIQYEDGGQSIKVNKLLAQQSGKVWRLMDYERITGILEGSHTNGLGGCLLIGSPGIGKSTYLVYHLVQCLSQGLPTYFYDGLTIYFDATGHCYDHAKFNSRGLDDHSPLTSAILLHFDFISLTLSRLFIYPFISIPLYFPLLSSSCSTILF